MTFLYRAYGLDIACDVPLPGPLASEASADVVIAAGEIPYRLDSIETETMRWAANARELMLHVPRVGHFHVREGRQIAYRRSPAAMHGVEQVLLGSCLGAALHQRGQLVLHASVVDAGGGAFAICGKSGTGKSTIASLLTAEGMRMLSDDLAVFNSDLSAILPGYPQTKLTPEALDRLGLQSDGLRQLSDERAKYAVPRVKEFGDAPRAPRGIFVMERTDSESPSFERLPPDVAIRYLIKHTYRRHYVVGSLFAGHFARCAMLARRVPVWLVTRPRAGDSTAFIRSGISQRIAGSGVHATEELR